MYGTAVLRASYHAGWPTLGGVPGRFTLNSATVQQPGGQFQTK